jgi:hypothetical protein
MHPDTLPFLRALYGSVQGFITLTVIHPDRQRPTPSRHIPTGDEAALREALGRLHAANQAGWGAYLSVATRQADLGRWRRGGKDDMAFLPALFVDIDANPETALHELCRFSPLPSCIVASGAGIHCYWLIQPTGDFALADRILQGLASRFQADRTNVAQSLRIPGTINTKPQRDGALCRLIDLFPDRRYTLADFAAFASVASLRSSAQQARNISWPTLNSFLNTRLVKAVAECLLSDYSGYIKANGYIASLCPCSHCRDYPGRHFNFDTSRAVGTCFGRHGRLLLKTLCELLRLDPAAYGGLYA